MRNLYLVLCRCRYFPSLDLIIPRTTTQKIITSNPLTPTPGKHAPADRNFPSVGFLMLQLHNLPNACDEALDVCWWCFCVEQAVGGGVIPGDGEGGVFDVDLWVVAREVVAAALPRQKIRQPKNVYRHDDDTRFFSRSNPDRC